MDKRAQVTIFIIIGIVIIVGVLAILYFLGEYKTDVTTIEDPTQFIENCVEDAVMDSLKVTMVNGGQITMTQSIKHYGETYNYLCYSGDFFRPCYNMHPMLQYLIESEIKKDTIDEVQTCFNLMRESFENRDFKVTGEAAIYSIDLLPGVIRINLDKKINLEKGASLQSFEDFDSEFLSPAYGLVQVVNDIVNDEVIDCKFDNYDYMRLNPEYHIEKINFEDNRFYIVTERKTGESFKFAVRNCVLPAGL